MNNELIVAQEKLLEAFPENERKIKIYLDALDTLGLTKQLSTRQIYHFLRICFEYKLDPLKKEIYCIPFRNKQGGTDISIVISYMEYLKSAEKNEKYQVPSVRVIDKDADGNPLKLADWYCEFKGKRKGDDDYFTRIFKMKEWNKGNGEWANKPDFMLCKVAMKNGLAWMYPELGGYISAEETIITNEGVVKDIYKDENVKEIKASSPKQELFVDKPNKFSEPKELPISSETVVKNPKLEKIEMYAKAKLVEKGVKDIYIDQIISVSGFEEELKTKNIAKDDVDKMIKLTLKDFVNQYGQDEIFINKLNLTPEEKEMLKIVGTYE